MYSIKELLKIGNGPSSSHTIGPRYACLEFLKRCNNPDSIKVILYGSLALTGKGHSTDKVIREVFSNIPIDIILDIDTKVNHPNTMDIIGYKDNSELYKMRVLSIGGGAIKIEGEELYKHIYPLTKFSDIKDYCQSNNMRIYEYVDLIEGKGLDDYLEDVYLAMEDAINKGISIDGILPGPLNINRKARYLYYKNVDVNDSSTARKRLVAYAYAVSEENASGGVVVTAPTCGSCGVLPAIMRYTEYLGKYSHEEVINALKTAALIGNLIKENASISGAEAGCQAEIGTACAMAAAYLAEINHTSLNKVEASAEIALEHHLGLTCDPVLGYVQIPCIERNAVGALRALDAYEMCEFLNTSDNKVSFDLVVETMLETGKDLSPIYRETSEGGLALNLLKKVK